MLAVAGMINGFGWGASAQMAAVENDVVTPTAEAAAPVDPSRDDPFSLGEIAAQAPGIGAATTGFRPAEIRPAKMPDLQLRGIGQMQGSDSPTALLDVEGVGLFVVTVEDTISLQGLAGDNVLRVVEINDISVTVEAGSFGELIVVR